LLPVGKCRIKNANADQRRDEEEQMAINIAMAIIACSIPVLIYVGCVMTRKKKAPDLPRAASHYELDRAA
jgi:hypothetical protein